MARAAASARASCACWQPPRSARLLGRGSKRPRPCSLAHRRGMLAPAQTMHGLAAVDRAESWCSRMQAGMPAGRSDRIYDRSGTDWRCAGSASYRTGRPNSRMRERVQYSAVGRGGCARTHLEPFSKPTEHINKHFGARERRSVRFLRSEFRLLLGCTF